MGVCVTTGCRCITICRTTTSPSVSQCCHRESDAALDTKHSANSVEPCTGDIMPSTETSGLIKDMQKIVARLPARESTNLATTIEATKPATALAEKNQSSRRLTVSADSSNSASDRVALNTLEAVRLEKTVLNVSYPHLSSGDPPVKNQLVEEKNRPRKTAKAPELKEAPTSLTTPVQLEPLVVPGSLKTDSEDSRKTNQRTAANLVKNTDSDIGGPVVSEKPQPARETAFEANSIPAPPAAAWTRAVAPDVVANDSAQPKSHITLPHAQWKVSRQAQENNSSEDFAAGETEFPSKNQRAELAGSTEKTLYHLDHSGEFEQPLRLQIRTKDWPEQTELDPVKRAYQIRQDEKAQFRAWQQDACESTNSSELNPHGSPMRTVSHRRQRKPVESLSANLLEEEKSNWAPTTADTRFSGIQLNAIPRTESVDLSPIVSIDMRNESRQIPDLRTPKSEQKASKENLPELPDDPIETPENRPNVKPDPLLDLPVSESIRRLTVRPQEKNGETIER